MVTTSGLIPRFVKMSIEPLVTIGPRRARAE
jgi:hypothetical protein